MSGNRRYLLVMLLISFSNLYGQKTSEDILLDFTKHANLNEYPELKEIKADSVYISSIVRTKNVADQYGIAFRSLFRFGSKVSRLSDSLPSIPWKDSTLALNRKLLRKLKRAGINSVKKDSANWSLGIACGVSYEDQNIVFVRLATRGFDHMAVTWALVYDEKWHYKAIYSSFSIAG